VARPWGGGGTASVTAAVGNDVPRASRSAVAAFFARMDVRRAAATMAGAAMLSRWWLREQMLDGANRGGGRATTMDGIFPRRRRDGNGCSNATVPSDRRRRQLRRGRGTTRHDERGGATTRDESGPWTMQGERVESDEGATRWRRTATEVRGRRRHVGRSQSDQNQSRASFEQVFWRAEKNTGVILRPQTPLSYPSQKKQRKLM
jgi:hypothetical protein